MNFDDTATPARDEDRRLAQARKLTLQPLHIDVAPEAATDTEIATRHLIDPAIANIPTDTEQNSTPIQPSHSTAKTKSSSGALKSISVSVGIVVALAGIITCAAILLI